MKPARVIGDDPSELAEHRAAEYAANADNDPTMRKQAVAKIESAVPAPVASNGITPAQAKIDAVAQLTMSAYAKASELRLTKEETDALQAEFPDDAFQPGAAGKEQLIYIEHAHLRDRFNSVFGMGQWSIVPRNRWAEDFQYENRNGTVKGSRVYVEAMLLVRGCFVGEAVGAMEYYPSNNSQNYGDAVEGAKTAALRRCAKELGVGLQAWKKEFCDGWWERRRKNGKNSNTRANRFYREKENDADATHSRQQNNSGASGSTESNAHPNRQAIRESQQTAKSKPVPSGSSDRAREASETKPTGTVKPAKQAVYATKESRMRFLNFVNAAPGQEGETMMRQFCIAAGMIMDNEGPTDLPMQYVPIDQRQTELFNAAISDFEGGGDAAKPFVNDLGAGGGGESRPAQKSGPTAARGSTEPESKAVPENRNAAAPSQSDDEWFMAVVCPVPRKGMKRDQYLTSPDSIGSMYAARHDDDYLRKRLFGLMNNFVPAGWVKRDGTKMPPNKADIEFREALDAFAEWAEKKGERI